MRLLHTSERVYDVTMDYTLLGGETLTFLLVHVPRAVLGLYFTTCTSVYFQDQLLEC